MSVDVTRQYRYKGKSDTYSNVYKYESKRDGVKWRAKQGGSTSDWFETEKEAAIAADKMLIKAGKEPVNVLKRK